MRYNLEMSTNALVRALVFAGVGAGGWFAGIWSERNNIADKDDDKNILRFSHLPGLPLFGTVSAATPFQGKKIVPVDDSALQTTPRSTRIQQIMRFGFPSLTNIKSFDNYVLSYDRRNRVAHWVFEHLTQESLQRNDKVNRQLCEFTEDQSIHPYFRSTNKDYKGSGFDRGHLAAAGNHRISQEHVNQTFFLCNIAPQVGVGFNRDAWNKLEKYVRKLTKTYSNVYVCTGPLYLPRKEPDGKTYIKYQVIGSNTVAVPTHFFKVVIGERNTGSLEMEAYVLPNAPVDEKTPLNVFQVPPDSIERASGLLFFDGISRKKLVSINGRKI